MPKTDQQIGIDPITMARFLVMPGLNDLIDAFARIPEGPMRTSVIHLAKTLADQYSGAPAEYAAPDPLLAAANQMPLMTPAESESRVVPAALDGPEAEVIRRRKKKQHAQQIAAETGIPRVTVEKIIAGAKAAGVKFPKFPHMTGRPVEEKAWHTSLDSISGQGLSRVRTAAKARGISVEEYLRRKRLAVDMAMKGEQYPAIEAATDIDMKTISLWLSNARASGLKIPYVTRWYEGSDFPPPSEQAAEAARIVPATAARPDRETASGAPSSAATEQSNIIRPSRFFGPFATIRRQGTAAAVFRAAERRGMTPDAYLDLQESIVRQRLAGLNPTRIVHNTGAGAVFVKDAIAEGKKKGAVYPPCPKGWASRATG